MVVLSQRALLNHLSHIKPCKSTAVAGTTAVPVVDLSKPAPEAEALLIKACEEFGCFKVINHGVPAEFIGKLESEALKFFHMSQSEKDIAGPPDPFGYGSKKIGPNGDVGWVEYLFFSANPHLLSQKNSLVIFRENPEIFWSAVEDYLLAVKKMTAEIVELIADGLRMKPRTALSELLSHEKSDSSFRMNHYPPCPEAAGPRGSDGRNMVGFGEHTDPQIVSVLRSNNTSGLQISLRDGTWVSVPPEQHAFVVLVGDALQVMTNGRFRSVKHRVLADPRQSRLSMIYFGGPPPREKIAPLGSVMKEGEESLYEEFTWEEYMKAAYKSRLADYRLGLFEKSYHKPSGGTAASVVSNVAVHVGGGGGQILIV